ncbi:MAG: T9SS type A sorting domain-containing protein, partial [Candidatus Cloacimonetes bacterium]|nr:T9SS type A sorting domain-containing protein [Candidatus Cloacimonadota bacterium]
FIGIIISLGLMLSSVLADDLIIQAQELLEKYSIPPHSPELNNPGDWDEIMRSKQIGPMVNCMPHYYSWVGREITIWGNVHWGDISSGTYEWDLGDGTILTGVVTNSRYIAVTHTYATGGIKTATLTVTDDNSQIDVDQTTIDVIPIVDKQQRINAAIEDGMRWLYLDQNANGWWYSTNDDYGMATTGLAVLAFEENAHHGNDDPDEDIYAETVQLGLDWILNTYGRTVSIDEEYAGNPDTDGDGIGVYFSDCPMAYENGIAILAVAASNQPDRIIDSGYLAGMTYYEVMEDAMNCIAWSQADSTAGGYRGGWRYNAYSANNWGDSDNSAVQWPVLALEAIEKNMPTIHTPQWVGNKLAYWLDYSQSADGGFGYTFAGYWDNNVKTAAGIASHYYIGTAVSDSVIQNALGFLDVHWNDDYDNYWYDEMFHGNFYALYGLKKAMEFYDITTFGSGPRDWYEYTSDYLLDDPSWGQNTDGSWSGGTEWITWTSGTTATSVLVLTRGVVQLQPIAVISSSNLPQTTNTPIAYSGANSYHQDPEEFITKWEWDFDANDGIDWDNPDAIGEFVIWEYSAEDTFEVTLRVTGSDTLTDTDVHYTTVSDSGNHAPIADPGGPYFGHIGDVITLDGSGSYDPDPDDDITLYEWDTNGDGQYDDATGVTTDVLFDNVYSGLIGLRVWDTHGACSDTTAPIYVTIWVSQVDLELTEGNVDVSNLHPAEGELVTFEATIECHTENGATVGEFIVRFYDGNPTIIVNSIGTFTLGPMGDGDDETVILNWTMPDTLTHYIYILTDAEDDVEEYNEDNNEVIVELGPAEPTDEPYNLIQDKYKLYPNYPNPFTNSTTISFSLKEQSHVNLSVYNIKGELVTTLIDDEMHPHNNHQIIWDGKSGDKELANGIYFYKIETINFSETKKMLLIK